MKLNEHLTARREAALSQFSPAMRSALKTLDSLLDDEFEFPDACYKAARKAGFSVDEVRDAYDIVQAS